MHSLQLFKLALSTSWILAQIKILFKRKNVSPFQHFIEQVIVELEYISFTHLYIYVCKTQMALAYRSRLHAKQS